MMTEIPDIPHALWDMWKIHADEFYRRDGRNDRFPHGGHDIANNPALKATLEQIAKRYLALCFHKFELLTQEVALHDQLKKDTGNIDAVVESLTAIALKVKAFDGLLEQANRESIAQLLADDAGFGKEAARQEISSPEARKRLALTLLSPVIHHAITAACSYSEYDSQLVTHSFLSKELIGFVPKSRGRSAA